MKTTLTIAAILTSLACFTLGYLAGAGKPGTMISPLIQPIQRTNSSTAVFE